MAVWQYLGQWTGRARTTAWHCARAAVSSLRTSRQTQLDPLAAECLFRMLEATEDVISLRFEQYVELQKGYGASSSGLSGTLKKIGVQTIFSQKFLVNFRNNYKDTPIIQPCILKKKNFADLQKKSLMLPNLMMPS